MPWVKVKGGGMSVHERAPVIIKRVKKVSAEAHHGGAWKVAYADFVTAMMAFFLLMWLMNATTEKQRKGIADYFSPTIPVNRVSGGGDGSFGGDSVFTEDTLAQNGTGGMPKTHAPPTATAIPGTDDAEKLQELENMLLGRGGESMVSDDVQRHIVTRVTDEGLLIELFDLEEQPLFRASSSVPTPTMTELLRMITRVFSLVENGIAIEGHVATLPVVSVSSTWDLSEDRASAVRRFIESEGLVTQRIQRVTGHADRKPVEDDVMAINNNRIVLILLRSDV